MWEHVYSVSQTRRSAPQNRTFKAACEGEPFAAFFLHKKQKSLARVAHFAYLIMMFLGLYTYAGGV